jgi:hypothetical protein
MTMKGNVGQLGQLQIFLEGQNFFFEIYYQNFSTINLNLLTPRMCTVPMSSQR